MSQKTILITGGTGYIGSHCVVAFQKSGYQTVILDNLCNSQTQTLDGIKNILGYEVPFYQIDIRDKNGLQQLFSKYKFDGVIHFAGLKAVGESCEKAGLYFDNNISGTITLCNTMKENNVRNIIFSSSCTVYGNPKYTPIDENHPIGQTSNPYGRTKQLLEKIFEDYSKFSGFNVINLRYFNPIGGHDSGKIGEISAKVPPNLLPFIFKVVRGEIDKLKIFGGDRPTSDGTCVRDYINVNDLVDGHLQAYEYIQKNTGFGHFFDVFNLGTGKGISVLEMVNAVSKVTGKNIDYEIVGRRSGDLGEIFGNADKAKKLLNRESKTSLEQSIKQMMKFYLK